MNAIIAAVKQLGVEDKDLQTTGFNINPRYDYVKGAVTALAPVAPAVGLATGVNEIAAPVPDSSVYYPAGTRTLSGYDINQTLTVKMRDLTKIGQIIEAATGAGANETNNLQFTLDNPDATQSQARAKAIDDAKSKAKELAKQLGVKLGRIMNYSDNGYYPPVQMNYAVSDMKASGTGAAVANVQTGENKVTANVNITYEIEQ